ncbi:transmembrane protein 234 homolog [Athalia rosae]|uniref:transmembrane protein 234 homolog n=1 Tax=Athalia rosae TaxID=37344 RepID=UPI0006254063|nr:transmembrane protein 234 homolog [Athalia rosae]
MAVTIESLVYLVIVALLWGATNPLIKKGSQGLDSVKAATPWGQFAKEIIFLVTNLKYIIPFLFNQCGSVLYFLALQNADLSLAVPVANSLTFVFTGVTGWILGEEKSHMITYVGMILILAGTTLCCLDKLDAPEETLN